MYEAGEDWKERNGTRMVTTEREGEEKNNGLKRPGCARGDDN